MGAKHSNSLKSIGWYIIGIGIFLGISFFAFLFIKGSVWLGEKVLPWLSFIMWPAIILDLLIFVPLGIIFEKTRGVSGVGLVVSSYIYGLILWFWSLLLAYLLWGFVAVFIGLFILGVGVVPVAIIATIFEGLWGTTGKLFLLLFMVFASRMLGSHFIES